MKPPAFVRFLPQREAALNAMRAFAIEHNDGEPVQVSEAWFGGSRVHLTAANFEGRPFGIAYEWTPEQLRRYLPQPRFDCPAARWPADVTVPFRELRV